MTGDEIKKQPVEEISVNVPYLVTSLASNLTKQHEYRLKNS